MSDKRRGYGWPHEQERARWKPLVDRGEVDCWRCGGWIPPGSDWQLGHDDNDRTRYRGAEHKRCNLGAAARKVNAQRRARRHGHTASGVYSSRPRIVD
jgi:hypothetical protein